MFRRLVGLLFVLLVLLHGYFYLNYGTLDPCTAATFKVINQGRLNSSDNGGLLFSGPVDKSIRSGGLWRCYLVAITGQMPNADD